MPLELMKMSRRRLFQIIMITRWMFWKPCSKDIRKKEVSHPRPFFIMLVWSLLRLSKALVRNFASSEGFVTLHHILFRRRVLIRGYVFRGMVKSECIVRFSLQDSAFH